MTSEVDQYLEIGCGRCDLVGTPDCKVNFWRKELIQLRRIALEVGLTEEYKWSQPCYTYNGANVLIITAFKDYAAVAFFKGALLQDAENYLVKPGKHSQAARQLRYTSVEDVMEQEAIIEAFMFEAIEVEKAGLQVKFEKKQMEYPDELILIFEQQPDYQAAFEALTPGRQRSYLLHFTSAKQASTRSRRMEKARDRVFSGKGFNEY